MNRIKMCAGVLLSAGCLWGTPFLFRNLERGEDPWWALPTFITGAIGFLAGVAIFLCYFLGVPDEK